MRTARAFLLVCNPVETSRILTNNALFLYRLVLATMEGAGTAAKGMKVAGTTETAATQEITAASSRASMMQGFAGAGKTRIKTPSRLPLYRVATCFHFFRLYTASMILRFI